MIYIKTLEELKNLELTVEQKMLIDENYDKEFLTIAKGKFYFSKDQINLKRLIKTRLKKQGIVNPEIYTLK